MSKRTEVFPFGEFVYTVALLREQLLEGPIMDSRGRFELCKVDFFKGPLWDFLGDVLVDTTFPLKGDLEQVWFYFSQPEWAPKCHPGLLKLVPAYLIRNAEDYHNCPSITPALRRSVLDENKMLYVVEGTRSSDTVVSENIRKRLKNRYLSKRSYAAERTLDVLKEYL